MCKPQIDRFKGCLLVFSSLLNCDITFSVFVPDRLKLGLLIVNGSLCCCSKNVPFQECCLPPLLQENFTTRHCPILNDSIICVR